MVSASNPATTRLWAITCYFNPLAWQRRLWTYKQFHHALNIPLLTVELGRQGELDLTTNDADQLLQIPHGATLWQKERLLNLAISALPRECEAVVWLDCDVLFNKPDWPQATLQVLEQSAIAQLFQRVHYLDQAWQPGQAYQGSIIRTRPSIASGVAAGLTPDTALAHPAPEQRPGTYANGMAWAARRELLDRHGLFDAGIIGGGDRAISCAAWGSYQHVFEWHRLNERQQRYYLNWAEPFHQDCDGQIGVVPGDIHHLWHGAARNRGLGSRHEHLAQFNFDPFQDIAIDEQGCWRWASNKPAMHAFFQDYFASRREDG